MSPSPHRQAEAPPWKIVIGALSLLMAAYIWLLGLQQSLSRPSVAPTLNLQQQEAMLLAEPALPESMRALLLGGEDPRSVLERSLEQIPEATRSPRQRQLMGLLADPSTLDQDSSAANDPLVQRLRCEARGGSSAKCSDADLAKATAIRLATSALLPLLIAFAGILLLLLQGWRLWRRRVDPWPELRGPCLSLLDMAILVAGGFVVLSAVGVPLVAAPLVGELTSSLGSPRREAIQVVTNYSVMALPSLLILRRQLAALPKAMLPVGGWLQWRLRPVGTALSSAVSGWLKLTPIVMLTGWLLVKLFGDPGGSNPLLELVLQSSRDPLAMALLGLTAVLLAPLFEELIFRGTLLPVLARQVGPFWGVLLSGLLFGLAHISVGELAPLTVLGAGLGVVRLATGRLLPCVLMHALWNAVTFVNLLLL